MALFSFSMKKELFRLVVLPCFFIYVGLRVLMYTGRAFASKTTLIMFNG